MSPESESFLDELITWRELGKKAAVESDKNDKKPVIIATKTEMPKEIRDRLRSLKFRWNSFRNEWEGYAIPDEIRALFNGSQAEVTICQ